MTTIKTTIEPGDILELIMIQGNHGKVPIARTDSNIICLIERGTKGYFEYHSLWKCEVVEVFETKIIIRPIELLKSSAAVKFEGFEKASQVFSNPKQVKKERVRKTYQFFKSSQELRA